MLQAFVRKDALQRRQRCLQAEGFLLPTAQAPPEELRGKAAGKAQLDQVELDDGHRGRQLVHDVKQDWKYLRASHPPKRSSGRRRRNRAAEDRGQQPEKEPAENKREEKPKL